jgi:hypothetical protein
MLIFRAVCLDFWVKSTQSKTTKPIVPILRGHIYILLVVLALPYQDIGKPPKDSPGLPTPNVPALASQIGADKTMKDH